MPAYANAISRPIISFCIATASTASMDATDPWIPRPAANHVPKGSSAPTITPEPADRIINPIIVLNVPLKQAPADFFCKISPSRATIPNTIAAFIRMLSMINVNIPILTSFCPYRIPSKYYRIFITSYSLVKPSAVFPESPVCLPDS